MVWSPLRRWFPLLSLALSCGTPSVLHPTSPASSAEGGVVSLEEGQLEGLRVRLSQGALQQQSVGDAPASLVRGEILPREQAEALLSRLPPLEPEPGETSGFVQAPASPPPPQAGEVVSLPFPPPQQREPPQVAPPARLTVVRHAPEGPVSLAPQLNLTFSQPMVALGSRPEVAGPTPVRLEPQPPGEWRWVGTQTLLFEPQGRFPMATHYKVTVPAGIRSLTGASMDPLSWSFDTPPLQLVASWPGSRPQDLQPLLLLVFDQAIDPQALLPFVTLTAGEERPPLRRVSVQDLPEKELTWLQAQSRHADRWLALRPAQPLPRDTSCRLALRAGAPSAEGPRTTPEDLGFDFHTYGPLQVREHRCGGGRVCPPGSNWVIRFSNPLDEGSVAPYDLRVDPALPGLDLVASGDTLVLRGPTAARTAYRVTLPADLRDTFGQTLGAVEPLSFQVGAPPASLQGPPGDMVVLDPMAPPELSLYSVGHAALDAHITQVQPSDWPQVAQWVRQWRRGASQGPIPGTAHESVRIQVAGDLDTRSRTPLDLSPWLPDGHGQLVVLVEPAEQPGTRERYDSVLVWVQATGIGLTAYADGDSLQVWATSLRDGRPLEAVDVRLGADGLAGSTDTHGLVTLPLEGSDGASWLRAALEGDQALLPRSSSWWGSQAWAPMPSEQQYRWFMVDDRGIYRPGEQAAIKGWLRGWSPRPDGDLRGLGASGLQLGWTLHGAMGGVGARQHAVGRLRRFPLAAGYPPRRPRGGSQAGSGGP